MTTGALGRAVVDEPSELVAEAARHRRALHGHRYRMLGSFEETR